MIDPVVLDRIHHAVETKTTTRFDVPVPDNERHLYVQELLWMGYTVTEIEHSTGWNARRIRLWIRDNQQEARVPPPSIQIVNANDVDVTPHPTGTAITTRHGSLIIEGSNRELAQLGRLLYGASTPQEEAS